MVAEGSETKEGLGAAVDAIGAGDPPAETAEQLAMLPLSPARAEGDQVPVLARGPGRPAGSKNKRTEAWVEFLLGRYSSPLVGLAEIYSRKTADLAAELKCSLLDAFDVQLKAMKELAPYVHQRLPQAVEVKSNSAGVLIIAAPGSQEAELAAKMGVDLPFSSAPQKTAENSQKTIDGEAKSHDEKSHEATK